MKWYINIPPPAIKKPSKTESESSTGETIIE
jgi:hypothetical protein